MSSGIHSLVSILWERQQKIVNNKYLLNQNLILGVSTIPDKETIESVPYLLKMDYMNWADIISEFSDYIVINITEKDKSKRSSMANLRQREELSQLVKMVRAKIISNLGKAAAYEFSHLAKNNQHSGNEIIDVSKEVRNLYYRNSIINK